MCCGGTTPDPPSGTHKTRLSHPNYPLSQGRQPVSQTWFRVAHAAQILPFQFRHHHHHHRCGWHFRSTLWYHKTRLPHPNYPHLSQGRPVSPVSGPNSCSSNYRSNCSATTTMCCGGITRSHSGTIRQTSNTPPIPGTWCCRRGSGPIRHMQLKFYRSIVPPPPPCAAVGLALQIHPWYHKTRLHIKLPTPIRTQPVSDVVGGQFGTCRNSVPIVPPPPCAAVGLALQIHPLVP
jgi:hypothetical protein